MSQALRKLADSLIEKSNTTCIFISQLREKIGVFRQPGDRRAAAPLKFFSACLDIRRVTPSKGRRDRGQPRAYECQNKVAPPFRQASSNLMYGGASRVRTASWTWPSGGEVQKKKSGAWSTPTAGSVSARARGSEQTPGEPGLARELETKVRESPLGSPSSRARPGSRHCSRQWQSPRK